MFELGACLQKFHRFVLCPVVVFVIDIDCPTHTVSGEVNVTGLSSNTQGKKQYEKCGCALSKENHE